MILERPFPTWMILVKRTKGRKRWGCKGKEKGQQKKKRKIKKGRKRVERKKKTYQAAARFVFPSCSLSHLP